jgi:hypothetical protein
MEAVWRSNRSMISHHWTEAAEADLTLESNYTKPHLLNRSTNKVQVKDMWWLKLVEHNILTDNRSGVSQYKELTVMFTLFVVCLTTLRIFQTI